MDKRAPMLCHHVPTLAQNIDVLEFPSLNITPGIITMWDQLGYEKTCTNIHIIYVLSYYKI